MLSFFKWITPALALGVVVAFSHKTVRAADAPAAGNGTIKVTVNDKDGKPVSGAKVSLYAAEEKKADSGDKGADAKAAHTHLAKGNKPKALQTATTGDDGTAQLTDVPAGDYHVAASLKGTGKGQEKVTVAAGQTATVTITLEASKKKGGETPGPTIAK